MAIDTDHNRFMTRFSTDVPDDERHYYFRIKARYTSARSAANLGGNRFMTTATTSNLEIGLQTAEPSYTKTEIEQFKHRDLLFGAAFAKIVSLMMTSPAHNHLHVNDLKWLVVPPVLLEQFAIVEAVPSGAVLPSPFAAALWATVSPEVDHRLSEDNARSVRLAADEWQSGDIFWIIDAFGHPDIVPAFLEELVATRFPGKNPKVRVIDKQGVTKTLFVGLDDL
jgi:hemolysin-activating ACP:hemolysin acyltransferase